MELERANEIKAYIESLEGARKRWELKRLAVLKDSYLLPEERLEKER